MRTIAILLLLLSILLTGCRDSGEQQTKDNPPIEHKEAVHPEQVGWEDDIELDEGHQWQVNRETTEGLGRLSQILENSSPGSAADYQELGERLESEKNNIQRNQETNGSTENLEVYLRPLDDKIDRLQEVESEEEGAQLKAEIQQHLSSYPTYFRSN